MPRVPASQNFVERAAVTDVKFKTVDAGADQVARGIQGLAGGVQDFAVAQQRIQDIQDEAAAKALDNEAVERTRALLWTGPDAFFNKQGFDAANARPQVEKALNDLRGELAAKATSKQQRRMFEDVYSRRMGAELEGVARHSIGQLKEESKRQSIARVVNSRNEAITYGDDPERRETAIATAESELAKQADEGGWAPEYLAAERAKLRSNIWRGIIDGKTRASPEQAAVLAEERKGEMLPEDYQAVKDTLYAPILERRAELLADMAVNAVDSEQQPSPANGAVGPVTNAKSVVQELFPSARVTDWKRDPNSALGRANPNSWHTRSGAAVDVAPIPGVTFQQYVGKLRQAGYQVIESRDEVKNPSGHATGPHWHVVIGNRGEPQISGNAPRRENLEEAYRRIDEMPGLSFDERKEAKQAIDRRVSRNETLLRRQQAEAAERGWEYVERLGEGFTSVNQIPPELRRSMDVQDRMRFKTIAEQNAAPKPRQTDWGFYAQASDAYASGNLMSVSIAEARAKLSDGDFEQFLGWRRDAMDGRVGGRPRQAATPKAVTHSRILSVTGDALEADGIVLVGKKDEAREKVAARRAKFVSVMSQQVEAWKAVNGKDKEPSDDDLKRMASGLLLNNRDGLNVFEQDDETLAKSMSPKDRANIEGALRSRGVSPTPGNIARAYRRLLAVTGA